MIRTSRCKTQYLANISPYLWQLFLLIRVRPASIRQPFPRQGNILPIKLLTLWPVEIESTHFVWKTNSLPLTYGHLIITYIIFKLIYVICVLLHYSTHIYNFFSVFIFWLYISKFLFYSILLNKAKYIFIVRFFTFVKNLFSVKLKRLFLCYRHKHIYIFLLSTFLSLFNFMLSI